MSVEFRYEKMKWADINEAVQQNRVVIIPIACVEDHGAHLPLDTDIVIVNEICRRTANLIPEKVLLFPTINNGYDPHHMDFPGTISIEWKKVVEYMLEITKSLVHHGFRRIVIVNAHGSNTPLMELAGRLTVINNHEVLALGISWWTIPKVRELIPHIRESESPGGMAHACELETSIYLAVAPEFVEMDKAVKDIGFPTSDLFWHDLAGGGSGTGIGLMEWWSTLSRTGVMGDPTKATAEKGEKVLNAAAEGLRDIVCELQERKVRRRIDHHVDVPFDPAPNTWE